jgi:hypothetical protein
MADPGYIVDGVLTDGEAWVGIATTTLGADAATVTFTSTDDGQVGDFSQYMDLVVISYGRGTYSGTGGVSLYAEFNSDSSTANYSWQRIYGNGASVTAQTIASSRYYVGELVANGETANEFAASISHIFDINSGKYKSGFTQIAGDTNGSGKAQIVASTWKKQAAISSVTLDPSTDDILAGSMFSLFGVLPRMVA